MQIPNLREWIFVAGFFVLVNVVNCLYWAFESLPSSAYILLQWVGFAWVITAWLRADSRRLRASLPFDMGWFVFLAWPVVLPYYLLKTRGVRGLLTIGSFLGLYVVAYCVGLCFFFLTMTLRYAAHK